MIKKAYGGNASGSIFRIAFGISAFVILMSVYTVGVQANTCIEIVQVSTSPVGLSPQPTGTGSSMYGQTLIVTAQPVTGYTFQKWTENGVQVSTNMVYSHTSTCSGIKNLVAVYTPGTPPPTTTYTISVSTSPSGLNPQPSGRGTYNSGQTATVTAQSVTGYTFQKWTENGVQVSTGMSYSFTVTGNRNLVAVFTPTPTTPTGKGVGLGGTGTGTKVTGSITSVSIGKNKNIDDYNGRFPMAINPLDISFYSKDVDVTDVKNLNKPTVLINFANLNNGGRVQFDWYDNKDTKISSWSYDIPNPSKGKNWQWYSVAAWPNKPLSEGHYYVKITTTGWGNIIDQSPKDAICTLADKGCSFDVIPANSVLKIPEGMAINVPLIPYGGKDVLTLPFEGGGEELIRILSTYNNSPSIEDSIKTIKEKYGKGFPYISKTSYTFQATGYAPVHATTVNDMNNTAGYLGECVSFVKTMTLNNLNTNTWYAGNYVMKLVDRDITLGTAVAIFSKTRKDNGLPLYNGDCVVGCSPRHVGLFEGFIYDDKDKTKKIGFKVFDQNYDSKGVVELHNIYTSPTNSKQYDDANAYRVVDWMDTR
jgi:hypothetical protein